MTHKGIRIKLKHDMVQALIQLFDEYLKMDYLDYEEKLIMASLAEIRHKFWVSTARVQGEYTFTLSPAQSLSMHLFYTQYINQPTSYVGNKLMQISAEVAQKYPS